MTNFELPPVKDRFSINVIQNLDGEILMVKRSEKLEFGSGLWGFPAGHIEHDESPRDCAIRELTEEIGDQYMIEETATFGPVRDSFYGGVYEIYLFHHIWLGGEIRLNHEHTDYRWVAAENFKNIPVMDGVDEDIYYLNIWPLEYLNKDKIPQLV